MIKNKLRRSIMMNWLMKSTRQSMQKGIVKRIKPNFRIRMKIKALKKNLHEREYEND